MTTRRRSTRSSVAAAAAEQVDQEPQPPTCLEDVTSPKRKRRRDPQKAKIVLDVGEADVEKGDVPSANSDDEVDLKRICSDNESAGDVGNGTVNGDIVGVHETCSLVRTTESNGTAAVTEVKHAPEFDTGSAAPVSMEAPVTDSNGTSTDVELNGEVLDHMERDPSESITNADRDELDIAKSTNVENVVITTTVPMSEEKHNCAEAAKMSDENAKSVPDEVATPVKPMSAEMQRLWNAVESASPPRTADDGAGDTTSSEEFQAWSYLLQYVTDSASSIDATGESSKVAPEHGRKAFDAFLHRYPYCYGYWKKYADYEKKVGVQSKVLMVFERGVEAIPLSVDLWVHYMNYVKTEFDDNPNYIRTQFERAVKASGREWRSDKLWDNYIKWESVEVKNKLNVFKLYERVIRNPTLGLNQQFDMYRDFVKESSPKDFLPSDVFVDIKRQVLSDSSATEKDSLSDSDILASRESTNEEEDQKMREKILSSRKKILKETQDVVSGRQKYEDLIKRPYFHIKPLERGQLRNWNDYLDSQIEKFDASQQLDVLASDVVIIFERCLIACALYEEFWLKYADFLVKQLAHLTDKMTDRHEMVDAIRKLFDRAITHHLPRKTQLRLRYAQFEESECQWESASEIFGELTKLSGSDFNESLFMEAVQFEIRRARQCGDANQSAVRQLYNGRLLTALSSPSVDLKPTDLASRLDVAIKLVRHIRYQSSLNLTERLTEAESICRSQIDWLSTRSSQKPSVDIVRSLVRLYLQLIDCSLMRLATGDAEGESSAIRTVDDTISMVDSVSSKLQNDKKANLSLLEIQTSFARRRWSLMSEWGYSVAEIKNAKSKLEELKARLDDLKQTVQNESHSTTGSKQQQQAAPSISNGMPSQTHPQMAMNGMYQQSSYPYMPSGRHGQPYYGHGQPYYGGTPQATGY